MCSKKQFSEIDAKIILWLAEKKRNGFGKLNNLNLMRKEKRCYFCKICKSWHLTSKENKE
jgi:hypothetical protein